MKSESIAKISDLFKNPDPKRIASELNRLSHREKILLAKTCYELTGKLMGSILEASINSTFQAMFQSIGKQFFSRIPYINQKMVKGTTTTRDTIEELRKVKLFADTSDYDLLTIADHITEVELAAEEPFLSQYEEVTGVYFVKDPVKVFEHNSKIALVSRNGIYGDDPCITGEKESSITATPTNDCRGIYIEREPFIKLIRSIPGLQEKIFQDVVERARQGGVRAEEQRRLIQEILDNIGQGSFSIDKAGEIGENYTAIASDYLGVENLAGVPFADLAFRNDRKVLRNYYRALHMLFSGNQFDNSMVLDLLPKEITINQRIFQLHYSFLQDGDGNVMSVFIRMEDLTLERELAKKEKEEKNIISKMQQNIGGFMDMLNDVDASFAKANEFAEDYWDKELQPDSDYVTEVMRMLHGSKGLSGQFELIRLKEVIHSMESWFLTIDKEGLTNHSDQFMELIQQFEQEVQFAKTFKENLGEGIIKILNGVSFTRDEFEQLNETIQSRDFDKASALMRSRDSVEASRIISNWKKDTERLAEKLEKQIDFQSEIDDAISVPKEMGKALNVNLGHLYRNCVDHGIEKPEKRVEAGKTETGLVFVKISKEEGALRILIRDDGAGLDVSKIETLARKNENLEQERVESYIDQNEQWRILFMAGFSSAEKVTDVSGRGVGMDAVLNTVKAFDGEIVMESELGKGSAFYVTIPLPTY